MGLSSSQWEFCFAFKTIFNHLELKENTSITSKRERTSVRVLRRSKRQQKHLNVFYLIEFYYDLEANTKLFTFSEQTHLRATTNKEKYGQQLNKY